MTQPTAVVLGTPALTRLVSNWMGPARSGAVVAMRATTEYDDTLTPSPTAERSEHALRARSGRLPRRHRPRCPGASNTDEHLLAVCVADPRWGELLTSGLGVVWEVAGRAGAFLNAAQPDRSEAGLRCHIVVTCARGSLCVDASVGSATLAAIPTWPVTHPELLGEPCLPQTKRCPMPT